eukprot:CAMPEP_0194378438 /NCGR_PEP_ID=MMETSP0174-20130528/35160_1 /TAXON_ID=216777 /ORGANISM="Proboscia alata, Strain PI-D3" /LENGTH=238 /DNA_ID=CAMNT_0039160413 /DNA_START=98 /DNA_END=814 /DNA_ORIENTATION=-
MAETTRLVEDKQEFDWPPLESNPEVFTEYLRNIGLKPNFVISEVYGFDEEVLAFLAQPTLGVIVAIERINRDLDVKKGEPVGDNKTVDFYMDQSGELDNACGIIACLHAILNSSESMISPESILDGFQNETKTLSPSEICQALQKNQLFKTAHKTFSMKGQSTAVVNVNDQSKVQHHFVSFVVNKEGKLVELDGTKKGPYVIGDCGDVLRGSIAEIQKRLNSGEISHKMSMMTLNSAM